MFDALQESWSDEPNAPRILSSLYRQEKATFAGVFVGTISYGIVITLFFRCLGALFNTVNRARGTIKWPLVAHTVAMFSILTASIALCLDTQSVAYIDDRNTPQAGDDDLLSPGPGIYREFLYSKANGVVLNIMISLNAWLADGLLLCRCCVIYSMNYWVIAFPCLIYLASLVFGIRFIYQDSQPISTLRGFVFVVDYDVPCYSIYSALNILLTIMIVTRLFLLHRNIKKALNAPVRVHGLYRVIVTSLIESYALYSVTYALLIGLLATGNPLFGVVLPIFLNVQVIAPFLITLRIANQSASSNVTVVSGSISSIGFGGRGGSTSGEETTPDGRLAGSMDTCRNTPTEPGVAIERTTNLNPDD